MYRKVNNSIKQPFDTRKC